MSRVRVLLRPSMVAVHLLAVAAVAIAAWLGWWQVSAWQESREDRALALADERPVPLAEVLGPDDPFPADDVGRPVEVSGTWLPGSTLFVDERRRSADSGDDGVWQVAMLAVCDAGVRCDDAPVVPVVLGWAPGPGQGTQAPAGPGAVSGWLQPSEQQAADAGAGRVGDVVGSLRTADLLRRTDRDIYSGYLILRAPAAPRGDLVAVTPADLPEPPASTALRNLLYGVEWWVFAAFAVYLWWRWSRDAVADAARDEVEPPVASSA